MSIRHRSVVYVSVLVAVLTAACSGGKGSSEGTLEIHSGSGVSTMSSSHPAHTPETFGSNLVCVKGGPVTITRVTYKSSLRPEKLSTSAWVVNEGDDVPVVGLSSFDGTAKQFMAQGKPGRLQPVKNLKVTGACPEKEGSFVDILVTAQASDQGAKISKLTVHYTSGGKSRSATSDWSYVFCGTATTAEPDCK